MKINNENLKIIFRGTMFVFGVFLLALTYNIFLLPNNLVVGGVSGLAVVLQKVFGWNATAFIYISSLSLLVISFIFLGKEETSNTIIGSILYPIMVSLTAPIASEILLHSDVEEYLLIIGLTSCLYGVASGLIYKTGFTTGGGDVIMQLLSKYGNMATSQANFAYSAIIVSISGLVFGISSFIYSLIILIVSNVIINKIIVGVSNSKVFYICTKKLDEIKRIIQDEYESGYTSLESRAGFLHKKGEVIMVVVSNRNYHPLKNRILEVDPEAFFIINDCYEVNGGMRKRNIPWF